MRVSVFTPSHDSEHIGDVWRCLCEQTYPHWEWVVVPNGDNKEQVRAFVMNLVGDDARVRLVMADDSIKGIGALKKFACMNATGDLFMEYDHDDIITHDCIETVVEDAKKLPAACFIFSDDVTLNAVDGSSNGFQTAFGWEHYKWTYRGKEYTANKQFDAHPRSICEILYSPDHVRVWSREAYTLVGGHNDKLTVCDDHEIMVRTYLAGVTFSHIRRPLYIHRVWPTSTFPSRVEEIQTKSREHRDKYLFGLVKEWCRRESLPMYDLGGAHNCPDQFVPIDCNPDVKKVHKQAIHCDIVNELRDKLAPNSVGCFRATDFLEHVHGKDVPKLMNTLYDLLVPGGWLLTMTPAICDDEGRAGRGAFQDFTHVSYWSSNNFWYLTRREQAKFIPELRCRFQSVRLANGYPSDYHRMHLIPYTISDMAALKDDQPYWPGPIEI